MRVFIALEVPPLWRVAASDAQRVLRASAGGRMLRFVDPALMHLTLRFLGEIDPPATERLQRALSHHVVPFELTLTLGPAGSFGPAARTAVAWLGIGGERERLEALVARVGDAVADANLAAERRPFRPHLTLARVHRSASPDDRRQIAHAIAALDPPPASPARFHALVVVRSHLAGAQPRYEVLSRHGASRHA